MLFHDSVDESAWGLALVGVLVVVMAAFLGEKAGSVQPKAPVEISHPDVSSPMMREGLPPESATPTITSPYLHPGEPHDSDKKAK